MFFGSSGKAETDRFIAEDRWQLKLNQQMMRTGEQNPKQKGGESMLNQCTLTGNLGGDPEVFYSSEGNPVANFSLAFHSSKKKTGWIKVVCFQKLAEVAQ